MATLYRVSVKIQVTKGDPGEVIQEEEFFFIDKSFAKMSHVADGLYELIEKLQKEK